MCIVHNAGGQMLGVFHRLEPCLWGQMCGMPKNLCVFSKT